MELLEVKHLKKVYTTRFGGNKVQALSDVSFSVREGEFVAIMGESGSGKTTLLNLLASLDKPTAGQVVLRGKSLSSVKERQLAAFRREHLGFIFQDFNLLDTFNVEDNIYLPLVLSGRRYDEMQPRLEPLAQKLAITDILKKFPYEISGGQKQRVAAARALITGPDIVLADEPTGALDSKASGALLRLLAEVNREGQTILMVTHSAKAASKAGRVLFIRDGEVFHQIYRGGVSDEELYQKIGHALTVSAATSEERQAV
ncbi:ABC transporter ATP-binding protein [Ruminococcaceae bacterium OttesenSCG-928-I18]|nr:ABC transporter ATP-binding protein [Ruminococcaceae bacterium OttesenSCG-928-I18]